MVFRFKCYKRPVSFSFSYSWTILALKISPRVSKVGFAVNIDLSMILALQVPSKQRSYRVLICSLIWGHSSVT